ncbi:hypothetical protein [Anaeromyxobacter diazotrophicus]|uniref:Lipoprotein n=1 Tax=Anaeromyxobacter diazotrophicus TaxID=2590199 RepID=A0A7I9VK92_9BACT|nr:hypothetical protein [Anaeromyxobacter diazotrophicus]GEJ56570.1 hypothetical protein AMYX_13110 [Anaeromyxobacter diazotrophicus]
MTLGSAIRRVAISVLMAAAAACSGRTADSASARNRSPVATTRDAAQGLPDDARNANDAETGAITGATQNAIPCSPGRGAPNRTCFAVAHGPFVLTDLEVFAFPWFPTQTQGWQEAIAFPGPSGVTALPPGFMPRWQTRAVEYWSSGWRAPSGEDWNSGEAQVHRYARVVHGARYVVGDEEQLYVSVSYRGCWKGDAFERETCSPGSAPEVSATFSGFHTH